MSEAQSAGQTIDPLVGQLLFGEFAVIEILSESRVSRTYKVKQVTTNKLLAMKTLTVLKAELVNIFKAAMQRHMHLKHENIVASVVCHSSEIGRPFFFTELTDGISLGDLLESGSLKNEEEVFEVVRQICLALEHAHRVGLTHGDLSPGKIMLDERDGVLIVKLLDFGFADLNLVADKVMGGTLLEHAYAPPEFLRNQKLDERSDVFSVAAIAYLLVAGKSPFEPALLRHYAQGSESVAIPAPLQKLRPSWRTIEDLERVILQALSFDPDQRHESVETFRDNLERWILKTRSADEKTGVAQDEGLDDPISSLKQSIHNMETLKRVQRQTEETVIMKVSDTLAVAGPRQSPRELAIKMLISGMIAVGFVLLAYSASKQHAQSIQTYWSDASIGLAKVMTPAKETRATERMPVAELPAASSDSPLISKPKQDGNSGSTTVTGNSYPAALNPKVPWPAEKLLIEVPYNPSASPSYGVTNNSR
jgi:serine/threonine protein kinase